MKLSKISLALLIFQLMLVSSVAAKYLYQRWHCPKVWTRAEANDPDLVMRGRYLSLQLAVDGCQSTLPSARQAKFPRSLDGAVKSGGFAIAAGRQVAFSAKLKVEANKLVAIRIPDADDSSRGQSVTASSGAPCDQMRLDQPVDFYISEHATDPSHLKLGDELWIEVTLPPKGPPRPIQLALKQNGAWKPLAFE
jgi:hypothetical protein